MNNKGVLLFILVLSVILGISLMSFFSVWVFLEVSNFIFVYMLSSTDLSQSSLVSVKYFLIQSLGSSIFLSMILISSLNFSSLFLVGVGIYASMFLKVGMFPFYFWVISVCNTISWKNFFILLTIQKILPFYIMSSFPLGGEVILVCTVGALLGALNSFTVSSTQKLMTYSSMYAMAWVIPLLPFNLYLSLVYFAGYALMQWVLFNIFNISGIFFNQQLAKKNMKYFTILSFFYLACSLGGLPPTVGFLMKVSVLLEMIQTNLSIVFMVILLMSSLLVLNFYLTFCLIFTPWYKTSFFMKSFYPDLGAVYVVTFFFFGPLVALLSFLVLTFVLKTNTLKLMFLGL